MNLRQMISRLTSNSPPKGASNNYTKSLHFCTVIYFERCMIKIFRGAGLVTPSKLPPSLPYEQLLPLPTPVFRCFWKDPLMTPHPTPPHFKHLSLLPPPHPPPLPPKKILITHKLFFDLLSSFV